MGRPLVIEESVTIACPADAVWATVTDYSSDHLWRPGIREMAPELMLALRVLQDHRRMEVAAWMQ